MMDGSGKKTKNLKVVGKMLSDIPYDCLFHISKYSKSSQVLMNLILLVKGFREYFLTNKVDTSTIVFPLNQLPPEKEHGYFFVKNLEIPVSFFKENSLSLEDLHCLKQNFKNLEKLTVRCPFQYTSDQVKRDRGQFIEMTKTLDFGEVKNLKKLKLVVFMEHPKNNPVQVRVDLSLAPSCKLPKLDHFVLNAEDGVSEHFEEDNYMDHCLIWELPDLLMNQLKSFESNISVDEQGTAWNGLPPEIPRSLEVLKLSVHTLNALRIDGSEFPKLQHLYLDYDDGYENVLHDIELKSLTLRSTAAIQLKVDETVKITEHFVTTNLQSKGFKDLNLDKKTLRSCEIHFSFQSSSPFSFFKSRNKNKKDGEEKLGECQFENFEALEVLKIGMIKMIKPPYVGCGKEPHKIVVKKCPKIRDISIQSSVSYFILEDLPELSMVTLECPNYNRVSICEIKNVRPYSLKMIDPRCFLCGLYSCSDIQHLELVVGESSAPKDGLPFINNYNPGILDGKVFKKLESFRFKLECDSSSNASSGLRNLINGFCDFEKLKKIKIEWCGKYVGIGSLEGLPKNLEVCLLRNDIDGVFCCEVLEEAVKKFKEWKMIGKKEE